MNNYEKSVSNLPSNDPDYCINKWLPLTEGMPVSAVGMCSWVMEREAKHLLDLKVGDRQLVGPLLKYIFPTIRRVFESYTVLDRLSIGDDPEELPRIFQQHVNAASHAIARDEQARGRAVDFDAIKSNGWFEALGARLASYALSYPGLN